MTTKNASRPIKDSKDADCSLVSVKKNNQRITPRRLKRWVRQLQPKRLKPTPVYVTQKTQVQTFPFLNLKYKSNRISWGFDELSSSSAWRVMVKIIDRYLAPKCWRAPDFSGCQLWCLTLLATTMWCNKLFSVRWRACNQVYDGI